MSLVRQVLVAALDALESDATLQDRVRRLLGVSGSPASPADVQFETVGAFSERVSLSERRMWQLVREGLPTVGIGRSRRVDVRRAIEWLRDPSRRVGSEVERDARRRARLAARQAAR